MKPEFILAVISSITTLISILVGFILQRDLKKIRDLERENKKLKSRNKKALNAIKGYQLIEEQIAKESDLKASVYRARIHKDMSEYFDSDFITPGNIDNLLNDLNE
jgi:hypothetical protein